MLRALTLSLLPLALAMEKTDNKIKTFDAVVKIETEPLLNNKNSAEQLSDAAKEIEDEWGYFFTCWNTLWWLGGAPIMYIGADLLINLAFGLGSPAGWFMWTCGQGGEGTCDINDFVLAITYIWVGFTIIELIVLAFAFKSKDANCRAWIGRFVTPLGCLPCCLHRNTVFGGEDKKNEVLETLVKKGNARHKEWKTIASTFACFWWLTIIPLIGTLWAYCNAEEQGNQASLERADFFVHSDGSSEVSPSPFIWILCALWSIGTTIACTVLGQACHQKETNEKSSKFLGCCDYDASEMAMRIGTFWACGSFDKLAKKVLPDGEKQFKDASGGLFCCCFG